MSNVREGIWRKMNLDDCQRVGHLIEIVGCELRIAPGSDSCLRPPNLSTQSRLYIRMPGNF